MYTKNCDVKFSFRLSPEELRYLSYRSSAAGIGRAFFLRQLLRGMMAKDINYQNFLKNANGASNLDN